MTRQQFEGGAPNRASDLSLTNGTTAVDTRSASILVLNNVPEQILPVRDFKFCFRIGSQGGMR